MINIKSKLFPVLLGGVVLTLQVSCSKEKTTSSSKIELQQKTTSPSFSYEMPDLNDSVEVLEKVQLLENRYLDYLEEAYSANTEANIPYDAVIFYAEALFNYKNRVTLDYWNEHSVDFENFTQETYDVEFDGSTGEALVSENELFNLLDILNSSTESMTVAPFSDLTLTGGTSSVLKITSTIVAIQWRPCIPQPTFGFNEEWRATTPPSSSVGIDCSGQPHTMTLAEVYSYLSSYHCQYLIWTYAVEEVAIGLVTDVSFAPTTIGAYPTNFNYTAMRNIYDPTNQTYYLTQIGTNINHSNEFWGGASCLDPNSTTWSDINECLNPTQIQNWASLAAQVAATERNYLHGNVLYYSVRETYAGTHIGPHYWLTFRNGRPGHVQDYD